MPVSRTSRLLIILLTVFGLVGSACAATEDAAVASRLEAADAAGEDLDADEVRQQVRDEADAQAEADAVEAADAAIVDDQPETDEPSSDNVADDNEADDNEADDAAAAFASGCAEVIHQPVADIPDSLSQIVLHLGSDLPEGATVGADVVGSLDVISGVVANGEATVVAGIDHYGDYSVESVSVDGQTVDFAPELAGLTVDDFEGTIAGTCAG